MTKAQTSASDTKHTPPDFSSMPQGAFAHPDDCRAVAALEKIPGVTWAMKKLAEYSYDRVTRASLLAKYIKAGPGAYPELERITRDIACSLDVSVPELFVRCNPAPSAFTTGISQPMTVISTGMLDLLDEQEMTALIATQVSHAHCGHLPFLAVSDFMRQAAISLGVAATPLLGPRIALEQWRRKAELSCDRGALLVCENLDTILGMLSKLGGGACRQYGGVSPAAMAGQENIFARSTSGIAAGRLYRASMYLDAESFFAPLRVAEISRWAGSPAHAALTNGDYAAAGAAADREMNSPPLWGEFAAHSATCPACGCLLHAGDESATCGFCEWTAGLKSAAGSAVNIAQQGMNALSQAASVFFDALQEKRGNNDCHNANDASCGKHANKQED